MINSEFVNQQAKLFAEAAKKASGDDAAEQVAFVLRRVSQREPKQSEIDRGVNFIATVQEREKASADEALRQFCLLSLNLNEFVYLE
jgi:hypothetical protein